MRTSIVIALLGAAALVAGGAFLLGQQSQDDPDAYWAEWSATAVITLQDAVDSNAGVTKRDVCSTFAQDPASSQEYLEVGYYKSPFFKETGFEPTTDDWLLVMDYFCTG